MVPVLSLLGGNGGTQGIHARLAEKSFVREMFPGIQ